MSTRWLLCVILLTITTAPGQDVPPKFRKVLSSAELSQNVVDWKTTANEISPQCKIPWSVSKQTLHGGRQEGVEIVVINNGTLEIVVCPTRGMGLLSVQRGEVALKWDSPVKEVVHPKFVDLGSRGGLGWLEGFNEFMCRCGLESNGHPGTDKFVNNVGDEAEMELTLHGKVANIPASEVAVEIETTAPFAIHLTGTVYERFMFGPRLKLTTRMTVIPGESSFRLTDELTNVGATAQEFQLIYHSNFGGPLLEEGSQIIAPARSVEPFNDRAAEGLKDWQVYSGPTNGFVEQVYLLKPKADDKGRTTALLHNRAGDKAASISWSLAQLPYLTVWKNTGAVADGFVTGIEPGTNYPSNRSVERQAGRVPVLQAGESRLFELTYTVYEGREEVQAAARRTARLGFDDKGN